MSVTKQGAGAKTVRTTAAKPAAEEKRVDLQPAAKVEASGAMIEPSIAEGVDVDNPAVDNNPRQGTSVASNQIDFNDPTLSPEEAVAKNLRADSIDAGADQA